MPMFIHPACLLKLSMTIVDDNRTVCKTLGQMVSICYILDSGIFFIGRGGGGGINNIE